MVTLENDYLIVKIKEEGAELVSIVDKKTDYEFLWQADEKYWARHAPVLFPIVGKLKDDSYQFDDKEYHMSQHGFARDLPFRVQNITSNSASLYLKNTEETHEKFPFEFSLQINYILHYSSITVSYEILNPSTDKTLYYSIGGHPAFNVSQSTSGSKEEFDDVSFRFEPAGQYLQIPLSKDGLTIPNKAKYVEVNEVLLKHTTFKNDALIYQISQQTEIVLEDKTNDVAIRMKPNRMDFVGIWSPYPRRAPFVCIEPWSGIADPDNTTGHLAEKYAIHELRASQLMTHDYTMSFRKN
ncbi:MAG: aldose 1-epimerase family protein [Ruoffia tabacinasalis]